MKRRMGLLLTFLLLFLSCAVPVSAAVRIDVNRETSLTIEHRYGNTPLGSAAFHLYRVANVSDAARFTLSGEFAEYPVKVNDLEDAGWKTAASTLAVYAAADKLRPLKTGVTNSGGNLRFGGLGTGLYLVIGETVTIDGTLYSVDPFLVSLPDLDADGAWNYETTAVTKVSADTLPTPGEKELIVIKDWKDAGNENKRPRSLQITLLRNGEAYDTVTLTADNFWRHTWSGLDNRSRWSVIENNVPADYTVTYTGNQTILKVTNTYLEDIPDDPIPGDKPHLPQTGLLWWPVPVLAVLGVALFGWGWAEFFMRRGKKYEK